MGAAFFSTVKGNVNDATLQLNGIAGSGSFRYVIGNGTSDPIINGTTVTSVSADVWFVQIDENGDPVWGASVDCSPSTIAAWNTDNNGNLIVWFQNASPTTFKNGDGTTFTPAETISGGFCVAKLGTDGNWDWARQVSISGGSSAGQCYGIAAYGSDIVLSLSNVRTVTYDGTTYNSDGTTAYNRGLLLWLDDTGTFTGRVWAIPATSTNTTDARGLTIDSSGNVYWSINATVPLSVNGTSLSGTVNSALAKTTKTTCSYIVNAPRIYSWMALNSSGDLVAVTSRANAAVSNFGNSVTVTNSGAGPVACRYNSSLVAQAATQLADAGSDSVTFIKSVHSCDSNILVSYYIFGPASGTLTRTIGGTSITLGSDMANEIATVFQFIDESSLSSNNVAWVHNVYSQNVSTTGANLVWVDGDLVVNALLHVHPSSAGATLKPRPGTTDFVRETGAYEVITTLTTGAVWGDN